MNQAAERHPRAALALEQALALFTDLGDPGGKAEALNGQGMLCLTKMT